MEDLRGKTKSQVAAGDLHSYVSSHADHYWLYPLNWLFTHLFWKTYMKRVLENVRGMAYREEPYIYA